MTQSYVYKTEKKKGRYRYSLQACVHACKHVPTALKASDMCWKAVREAENTDAPDEGVVSPVNRQEAWPHIPKRGKWAHVR